MLPCLFSLSLSRYAVNRKRNTVSIFHSFNNKPPRFSSITGYSVSICFIFGRFRHCNIQLMCCFFNLISGYRFRYRSTIVHITHNFIFKQNESLFCWTFLTWTKIIFGHNSSNIVLQMEFIIFFITHN